MASGNKKAPMNFKSMAQADVPQGRNGKHKDIVTRILSDLDQVKPGVAIKVPLAQLKSTKEKVRSALNRATRKRGGHVAKVPEALSLQYLRVANLLAYGCFVAGRRAARERRSCWGVRPRLRRKAAEKWAALTKPASALMRPTESALPRRSRSASSSRCSVK